MQKLQFLSYVGLMGCLAALQIASPALAQRKTFNPGETPWESCQRVNTDDNPGRVPAALFPAFMRSFGSMATSSVPR